MLPKVGQLVLLVALLEPEGLVAALLLLVLRKVVHVVHRPLRVGLPQSIVVVIRRAPLLKAILVQVGVGAAVRHLRVQVQRLIPSACSLFVIKSDTPLYLLAHRNWRGIGVGPIECKWALR